MIETIDIFLILLTLLVFFWGILQQINLWKIGQPENRSDRLGYRIKSFLREGLFHSRILQDIYPGTLHLLIFIGFLIPLLVILAVQFMFTLPPFPARILSFLLDLIALAALVSLLLLLYRRYVSRPEKLDNKREDIVSLLLIFFIVFTGLIFEGLRLSVIAGDTHAWAPIGRAIAFLFDATGLSTGTKSMIASVVFRIHFFLVLITVAYIPHSKLFHLISSPMNMILRSLDPKGILAPMDFEDEEAESFGVSSIKDFTWKQLLDLDACTRCGRCQDHCPAHLTQKPLSPKKFIQDLRDHFHEKAPLLIKNDGKPNEAEPTTLVGHVIEEDVLWACTTCRSCMEHCPVYIEHVDKILDVRRYQVMMESKFPEELQTAFRGLETNSNPWGIGFDTRADWITEMDVPLMAETNGEDIEYLFFVGCIRSYDDRNKRVSLAMAKILNHLGTKFAVLGMEEGCCGDPARRVGNEYLYQTLAQTNIETFNKYKVTKILTTCPHCFNTLKNEYAQLGFKARVVHHAEFLQENIRQGRLKLENPIAKRLTYHDPCYLGRYSSIFDPPREILGTIPAVKLVEMERSRKDSLCCGAGGGWMWMDEKIGQRINIRRFEDALAIEPEGIATACPFCVTMFSDAAKDKGLEEKVKIWDIAELVALAIQKEP
ncbi:MAG: 4Fe-4S dicluster domain-containing protein [Candidatus Aminicenantes bacterium]|nr:4Fe-4S dicluster domain-containing protein [Candidatus Aminicenantes bacterium]